MADWQYRGGGNETRYVPVEAPRGGYPAGERYSAGSDRYPAERRAPPEVVSKRPRRDYDDGYDELPPTRSYPARNSDRGEPVAYAPRERAPAYDERPAPRAGGGWRGEPEPIDLYAPTIVGGGAIPMALPDDPMMAGARPIPMDVRGAPVVINGAGIDGDRGAVQDLPPDASSTLFVDGFPQDCPKREAAHIFRPFIGYKEVRLVHKDAKRAPGEKVVLCFVEFADPRCAAIALEALQGYRFDESDRESPTLRLTFARNPGPRSGPPPDREGGYRGGGGGGGGGRGGGFRDGGDYNRDDDFARRPRR